MTIIFQKKKETCILKIIRDDGSVCWSKTTNIGILHDLCHYVVEKNMNFKNAFYNIINQGFDISDFEKPRDQRPKELIPANFHLEAIQSEHMSGLFQMSLIDQTIRANYISLLKQNLEEKVIEFPKDLNETMVQLIADEIDQLVVKWKNLIEEEKLSLILD